MKSENTYIIHPETKEQEKALKAFVEALKMKFEVANEKEDAAKDDDTQSYDPDFVAKIEESQQQARKGKITRVEKDELKDFLGLE